MPLSINDYAFCPECYAEFEKNLTRNCSFCAKELSSCDCPTEFLSAHFVGKLYKSFRYSFTNEDKTVPSLIYTLKRRSRWDVTEFALDLLEKSLKSSGEDFSDFIFTYVPRRKNAVLKYGVDQSANLAKGIAKRLGAKYMPILYSKAKKEQKQLTREERLANAKFYIKRKVNPKTNKVVIVDDIVTTGASLGTASALIRSLGIKNIRGLVLAIAYPD